MRFVRGRALLVAAVLICGGCKSAAPSSSAADSSAAPPLTGDPAMIAIATKAQTSLAAAKFVHEVVTLQEANPLVISTTFENGVGCVGTEGVGHDLVKFIYAGGVTYVQGSRPAFEALNVQLSEAQWTFIGRKWINVTADDGNLGSFGDFAAFLPTDFPTVFGAGGTLSAAAPATIGGKQAVGIQDVGPYKDNTTTVYVSAGPDRLPLLIQPTATATSAVDSSSAVIDFSDYGVAATIAAPSAAITISDVLAPH